MLKDNCLISCPLILRRIICCCFNLTQSLRPEICILLGPSKILKFKKISLKSVQIKFKREVTVKVISLAQIRPGRFLLHPFQIISLMYSLLDITGFTIWKERKEGINE